MKKTLALLLTLTLLLAATAASASIYGGVEERQAIAIQWANDPNHGRSGDQGGHFTAALNATQPVYYTYDWDMNFLGLGLPIIPTETPSAQPVADGSAASPVGLGPTLIRPDGQGTQDDPYLLPFLLDDTLQEDLLAAAGFTHDLPRTGTYYVGSPDGQTVLMVEWSDDGASVIFQVVQAP